MATLMPDVFSLSFWVYLALGLVVTFLVAWCLLFLVSLLLPLLFGYKGYMRKVRLQLFLGLYTGKSGTKIGSDGNYQGMRRVASVLRNGIPDTTFELFDRSVIFLTKSGDIHRQPMKWYFAVFLLALSILEMFAFSLAISPVLGDINLYQQYIVGTTIAFTLGVMFYILMHTGGVSWYRRKRIKEAKEEYRLDPDINKGQFPSCSDIHPSVDQRLDDNDKRWRQVARRITPSKGHFFFWAVLALMALSAISISVRFGGVVIKGKETVTLSQSSNVSFMGDASAGTPAAPGGSASEQPKSSIGAGSLWEHWVFFIAITFVFIVTQGVALVIGHESAFASESSRAPAKLIAGNYQWDAYLAYKKKLLHEADELLQEWIAKTDVGISDKHKTTMGAIYPELVEDLRPLLKISYRKPKIEHEGDSPSEN